MKVFRSLLLTIIFSAADAFFGTSLYLRWNKYELFGKDVINYRFVDSMFEFWLFSVMRLILQLSAASGILCNPQDSVKYIKAARYPVGVLNIIVVLYTMSKIMLYTEHLDGNHDNDAWFLTLGTWTMIASLAMYCLWVYTLHEAISSVEDKECRLDHESVALITKEEHGWKNERGDSEGNGDNIENDDNDDDGDDNSKMKNASWYSLFARLITYSKQDWHCLLVGLIALIIATVGKTFLPLLAGRVIDGVVLGNETAGFHESILLMTLISCVVAVANGVRSGCLTVAMASLNQRITNHLFDSILKQDMGFFDKNRTGAITSRLTSDTTTMSNSLGGSIKVCLRNILQMIAYTIVMVVLSWRLSVITVMSFILLAVITDIVGRYYEKLSRKVQSALANANIVAEETISSMKTVRSFANEAGEKISYWNRLSVAYHLRKNEAVACGFSKVMVSVVELMVFVVTLFYGGHLVVNDQISGGMLVSYILYQQKIGGSIEDIADGYTELMKAVGASRKVFELIDQTPVFRNEGRLTPKEFEGHLEFRNVTFAYPTRPSIPVLNGVSFTAAPGEVLALVGPSGGGKSSCINLIEHFYEPTFGEVLIDGINILDYDHAFLHAKVALVGQEPVLYARSIKDNISYSLDECSTKRIHNAAKHANAHHFVMSLQKGYETETGEKGVRLSGGQKQRVAIARALVRNPQMLLLDEATSALDAESEYLVQQALSKNFGSRTVVIVAHRLSTIEKADRIVVIDHGFVVEQGRHHELIKANGLYAGLVRRQLLGHDKGEESNGNDEDIEDIDSVRQY